MKGLAITEFPPEGLDDGRVLRLSPSSSGDLRFTVMLHGTATGPRAVGVVGYEDDGRRAGWYFETGGGERMVQLLTSRAAAAQAGFARREAAILAAARKTAGAV